MKNIDSKRRNDSYIGSIETHPQIREDVENL